MLQTLVDTSGHQLRCASVQDSPWFCASDVCTALGYRNVHAPVQRLPAEHKSTWNVLMNRVQLECTPLEDAPEVQGHTVFVDEAGFYSLALNSRLPSARAFREWVVSEVLPTLRKEGHYEMPGSRPTRLNVENERQLHEAVVKYLRTNHPALRVAAGLGELQRESAQRLEAWAKGYQKGQPDLVLFARSGNFSGLAIELKTPTGQGVVSPEQTQWLLDLKEAGFKTLVCNDLFEVIGCIEAYLRDWRHCCAKRGAGYRSLGALANHMAKCRTSGPAPEV
jgi:prophage antirepressor-like protein